MDPRNLKELLEKVREGTLTPDEAAARLATLPYEDLGFAKVDHHRALRRGFPEVGLRRRQDAGPDRWRSSRRSRRTASACW